MNVFRTNQGAHYLPNPCKTISICKTMDRLGKPGNNTGNVNRQEDTKSDGKRHILCLLLHVETYSCPPQTNPSHEQAGKLHCKCRPPWAESGLGGYSGNHDRRSCHVLTIVDLVSDPYA